MSITLGRPSGTTASDVSEGAAKLWRLFLRFLPARWRFFLGFASPLGLVEEDARLCDPLALFCDGWPGFAMAAEPATRETSGCVEDIELD